MSRKINQEKYQRTRGTARECFMS